MLPFSANLEYMHLHTRPVVSNATECNADMSTDGSTPTWLTLDFHSSSHDDSVRQHNTDLAVMCSHFASLHIIVPRSGVLPHVLTAPSHSHLPPARTFNYSAGTNSGVAPHATTSIENFHGHDESFKFNPPYLAH